MINRRVVRWSNSEFERIEGGLISAERTRPSLEHVRVLLTTGQPAPRFGKTHSEGLGQQRRQRRVIIRRPNQRHKFTAATVAGIILIYFEFIHSAVFRRRRPTSFVLSLSPLFRPRNSVNFSLSFSLFQNYISIEASKHLNGSFSSQISLPPRQLFPFLPTNFFKITSRSKLGNI